MEFDGSIGMDEQSSPDEAEDSDRREMGCLVLQGNTRRKPSCSVGVAPREAKD